MKVTTDTITDAQIRGLLTDPQYTDAKAADRPPWRTQLFYIQQALDKTHVNRVRAREVCAEIWNSRHAEPRIADESRAGVVDDVNALRHHAQDNTDGQPRRPFRRCP